MKTKSTKEVWLYIQDDMKRDHRKHSNIYHPEMMKAQRDRLGIIMLNDEMACNGADIDTCATTEAGELACKSALLTCYHLKVMSLSLRSKTITKDQAWMTGQLISTVESEYDTAYQRWQDTERMCRVVFNTMDQSKLRFG